MGRQRNIEKLKEFKKSLGSHISVKKMLLFGSRAWGKPGRYSDFDILIVSPDFRGRDSLQRPLNFYKYWHLDYPVDFLCYTPEEFAHKKKQIGLVQEAAKNGVEVR